jgi:hypothetical protein
LRGLGERARGESEKANADIAAAKEIDPSVSSRIDGFGIQP